MDALNPLEEKGLVTILKPLGSKEDPILKIVYKPASPSFTIRHILNAIEKLESIDGNSRFMPSVYYPPTLEQLSRQLQEKERKKLLYRMIFTIILAIPTFVIGIVWMTLLPKDHSIRMWLEEPMWAGATSRVVWALFFLATPAEFYSAYPFHRRSIKELKSLWRKGSKTPILMRFVRFGSMDLLISLGVSISYFSSIALLAISSSQTPMEGEMGDDTTYFDSVVFLAMFLLIGRFTFIPQSTAADDTARSIPGNLQQEPHCRCCVIPRSA
jgi:Cu+-exporting ATPase